jgi:hypothetical protein
MLIAACARRSRYRGRAGHSQRDRACAVAGRVRVDVILFRENYKGWGKRIRNVNKLMENQLERGEGH